MDDLADNEEPLATEEEAAAKEAQWLWRNGVRRNNEYGDWLESWAIGVKRDGSVHYRHNLGLGGKMDGLQRLTDGWNGTRDMVPEWALGMLDATLARARRKGLVPAIAGA